MIYRIISLILVASLACFCTKTGSKNVDNGYVLNGSLKGISNGIQVYLFLNNKVVDSTQVKKEKFTFEGSIEHPTQFGLLIKKSNDFKRIWLEQGIISLESNNGQLESSIIKGSKSHIESEQLWVLINPYRSKRDSLTRIVQSDNSDSLKSSAQEELSKVYESHLEIETDFITNNPSSYVSASTLDFYSSTFGRTQTQRLFDLLSIELKESSYGASIQHFLELKHVEIGNRYVNFSMKNIQGKTVQISDFKGKVILLDFWASWCRPCIKEFPALKEAYSKYKHLGFEIIGISEDQSEEQWRNAIKLEKLEWTNLWEPNGMKSDPYLIYGINGIPDNFLIDGEGIIVSRNLRGKALIEKIAELADSTSL